MSVKEFLARIGKKGGLVGGRAAAKSMTKAERIARAKKAAKASSKVRTAKARAKRKAANARESWKSCL